jgi:hypothetical protein
MEAIMATTGPVQDMIKQREAQRQCAIDTLNGWKQNKFSLKRPVFLVPGWTDEGCACWISSNKKYNNKSIKDWLIDICLNPTEAHYINFEQESPTCKSFLDFGEVLKKKIWDLIGKDKEFDIIGHSRY